MEPSVTFVPHAQVLTIPGFTPPATFPAAASSYHEGYNGVYQICTNPTAHFMKFNFSVTVKAQANPNTLWNLNTVQRVLRLNQVCGPNSGNL